MYDQFFYCIIKLNIMSPPYHILAKKSIHWLITALVLFCLTSVAAARTPTDPNYSLQSSFYQQVGLPIAWDYTVGSDQVVVAVIDIGVDITHPDLVKNIWRNPNEAPANGVDDDHNGYIDDLNGWNFVEGNNQVGVPNAAAIEDSEIVSHGTMAAGLIGAVGGNSLFGAGMNWRVRIMPLRAISNSGGGSFANVVEAVNYAVDNGADIISLSVVGHASSINLEKSLLRAYNRGVLVVVAAGNQGLTGLADLDIYPNYPVCSDRTYDVNFIIGVTSVDKKDKLSAFSNYGSCVDLSAPGEKINSTLYYQPADGFVDRFGGNLSGTSFSAPFVAGAGALLKSLVPSWGAKEITKSLLSNSDRIDNLNPLFTNQLGAGRLNIGQAARAAMTDDAFLADSINSLYYFTGVELRNYSLNKSGSSFIDRVSDAKLIDIAMADIDDDKLVEGILLIKRDAYYYARIIGHDGSFIREFALAGDEEGATDYYNKLEVVKAGFALEKNKSGRRSLVNYDFDGRRLRELPLANGYYWAIDKSGDDIILAKVINNQLTLKNFDWQASEQHSWSLSGVQKLYDLQVGDVRQGGRREQAVLARSGNEIKLFVIDLPSGSWLASSIEKYNWRDDWRLLVGPYGGVVLPYELKGGKFTALKEGSGWLKEVELEKVSQSREYKLTRVF